MRAELYFFTTSEVECVTGLQRKKIIDPQQFNVWEKDVCVLSQGLCSWNLSLPEQQVWVLYKKQSVTVYGDGLMRDLLTYSDGSLTLPVGLREAYDSKQTRWTHFISAHLVFSEWNQDFRQMPMNYSMTFSTKQKNKYNMKTLNKHLSTEG